MNSGFVKFQYRLKNMFQRFFSNHKKWFFISALFVLFGFCLGIFIVVKYSGNVAIDNIFDKNLAQALTGDRGVFGIFFNSLLVFTIICAIIIFLNFKPWMMVFTFICLTIYGYILGFNVAILTVLFGMLGLFNALLIIIPIELCIIFTLLIISSVALYRNVVTKKFGCVYYTKNCWFNLYKVYIIWYLIGVFFILIKSMLLPLIRLTIIV